jgi:N-acetylmuramoyl-L-alanine amidase
MRGFGRRLGQGKVDVATLSHESSLREDAHQEDGMKICVDAGHGMNNKKAEVFDPGATKKVGTETFAEADIVLRYAHTLRQALEAMGKSVFMTRTSSADSAPVVRRATRAANAGCDKFISLHLNSNTSAQANGVEVLFRDAAKDKPLADKLQKGLVQVTKFKDRGSIQRTDLAVLKFKPGPAVLIELGFISSDSDRSFLLDGTNRDSICNMIARAL